MRVSFVSFSAEEDKKVLDACEKWLQQAEALVIEADAKIEGIMHQDSGNLLAEEWVTFVHKYSMQIKDIEQVRPFKLFLSLTAHLSQMCMQLHALPCSCLLLACLAYTTRSGPYWCSWHFLAFSFFAV